MSAWAYLENYYSCKNLIKIFYLHGCGEKVLVECPRCGTEISTSTREWDYHVFHVKKFDCERCDKGLMAYFRKGKLSHTIPKRK